MLRRRWSCCYDIENRGQSASSTGHAGLGLKSRLPSSPRKFVFDSSDCVSFADRCSSREDKLLTGEHAGSRWIPHAEQPEL